ncbi:MAG: leucine-rich repeat protein [Solobacterium sp.]|nr:leucine-rich repeat protein [Solobacterium sp.]
MVKKLYAVLMSLFMTAAVFPQNIYAEEEPAEETAEEISETEEITEEEIPEDIIEEEVPEEEITAEEPEVIEPEEEVTEEPVEEVLEKIEEEITEPEQEAIQEEESSEEIAEEASDELKTEVIVEETLEEEVAEPEEEISTEPTEEIIEETIEETTEIEAANDVMDDFEYSIEDSEITISKYIGTDTEVSIPSEIDGVPVTRINDSAFQDCSNITSIIVPDTVIKIGEYAFKGCSSLSFIMIPASVTSFGFKTFEGCSNLKTAGTFGSGANYQFGWTNIIPSHAFSGCSELSSLTIPEEITDIRYEAFYGCSSLKTAGPIGSNANYQFGWTTSIPVYAFCSCTGLVSAVIPDGITSIGKRAFFDCNNLVSVDIPDSVSSIGEKAFSGCGSLTDIILPNGIDSISGGLFSSCKSLTTITIPDSVTSIELGAFGGCSSLAHLVIPSQITSIGSESIIGGAFSGCDSLRTAGPIGSNSDLEFGWTESIPDNAFSGCGLTSIIIPETITSIGGYAFYNCRNLVDITIPDGITSLNEGVFHNCTSLKEITIPDSVTFIDNWAFDWCESLTSISIPGSVNTIEDYAFRNCYALSNVTISDGVVRIGEDSFIASSLKSVVIPETVSDIGNRAFGYVFDYDANGYVQGYVVNDDYVIYGYSGTAAETYANENGITFVDMNTTELSASNISTIAAQTYTGKAIKPAVTVTVNGVKLVNGTDYTISYENNINTGTATVTIEGIGGYTGTVTKEFTIIPRVITPEVTLSTSSYTYNGKAKTPGVTVKDGDTTLVKGTDYTVTYGAGRTNVGTYNVKVTLQGNYSGSKKVSFTITAKAITPAVTLTTTEYTYNGKARTPGVTVMDGSTKLVKDTDYTVTYASGRTKVGTYNVTVKLKGNYSGKKTVQFTILPAATTKIAVANKAGGIKIAWKAVTGATGYKIYRNGKLAKTITGGDTVSWGDTKATGNGTKYTYKIVAFADAGTSKVYKEITTYWLTRPTVSSLTNSSAGKLTVKWGRNTAVTGYQVQYSTSSDFTSDTTKTVTIKSNTTVSKVIGSLTKGKTYYVRVRSYKTVSSVNYYSMWSAASKLKLSK